MATQTTATARPKGLAAVFVQTRAGHDFGHNCQLSREHNIRVCTDPHHDRDAALLREALIACGVLPDPIPGKTRQANGKTRPDRGHCGVCRRSQSVGAEGQLYKHPARDGDEDCDGSYGTPVAEEKAA
jgi:hypothetical protein